MNQLTQKVLIGIGTFIAGVEAQDRYDIKSRAGNFGKKLPVVGDYLEKAEQKALAKRTRENINRMLELEIQAMEADKGKRAAAVDALLDD